MVCCQLGEGGQGLREPEVAWNHPVSSLHDGEDRAAASRAVHSTPSSHPCTPCSCCTCLLEGSSPCLTPPGKILLPFMAYTHHLLQGFPWSSARIHLASSRLKNQSRYSKMGKVQGLRGFAFNPNISQCGVLAVKLLSRHKNKTGEPKGTAAQSLS